MSVNALSKAHNGVPLWRVLFLIWLSPNDSG